MFQLIFNNLLSGMKKFLLLFVMLSGMMMQQGLHAADVYSSQTLTITTSDDGKTVTINSSQAGALWALLEKGEPRVKDPVIDAIKAVTGEGSEIVFSGQFCGDDLKKLHEPKPGQNCCVQETVDMENAEFKKRVDLTDAMDAYKISVDALPNQTEEQISDALKTKAQEVGITLADGDIAVVKKGPQEKLFYKYNSTTQQWSETSEPFFASPDRLDVCINVGQAWEKYAGAMVDGVPTLFQYKQDPSDYQSKWMKLDNDNAYDEMTFKYWGSNVKTAITSINASENDVISSEFCEGCSNLQVLTLGSGSFNGLGNNVTSLQTVNIKKDVTSLSNGMFNEKSSITTISFEDGEKNLTVGEDCFNNCSGITSLVLPARLSSMGKQAFANTTGVASLSIPENSRLTTIPEQAFKSCGNNTQAEFDITIPRSVTLIEDEGFGDMWRLKIVRFTGQEGDAPLVIETGAFAGGTESNYTLSDVYVDIDPDDRKLICEYGAFSYTSMEGQTSVANIEALTTLHFTEDYWDYYAGNWKKGVTFDQAALNSFKDGCDPTKTPMNADYMIGTNEQIHASNGHIDGKQPANGWQQFAKTSTGIIIVPKGKFYRTYSTPSVLVKPSWMKIYRVKDFQDGFIEGTSDASSAAQANAAEKKALTEEITPSVTVDGKTYNIIPINTGVIRVDVRDKESIYYILELERTSAANAYTEDLQYPYSESGNKVNYMYPTNGETATIGPVVKDGGTITHRIFGLLKVTQSGVIPQFSRAKVGTKLGDHRAYLKLPASKFHWRDEKNGSSQDATGNDVVVDENNTYAKISLFFDDDFEDVNGGIATEIINAIEEDMYKNDSFYTLQGVKVAKPTSKGVYIHNGKKIYIK